MGFAIAAACARPNFKVPCLSIETECPIACHMKRRTDSETQVSSIKTLLIPNRRVHQASALGCKSGQQPAHWVVTQDTCKILSDAQIIWVLVALPCTDGLDLCCDTLQATAVLDQGLIVRVYMCPPAGCI